MRSRTTLAFALLLFMCLLFPGEVRSQDDYLVFRSSQRGESPDQMLFQYLTTIVRAQLQSREKVFANLETPADIQRRGEQIRNLMVEALGPWPPSRTPLKAQITGRFERERYRIEKIVFQSIPGFFVTANLYLPPRSMGPGPFPAVLGPCGHTMLGKAFEPYQKVYSTLASLGFVVLTYDPPGQGERLMYYNKDLGESLLGSSTVEHTMAGIQCLLSGSNAAGYFIWDGLRGIDYLAGRAEVDSARIAVTGNSGGGTLTAYIAALDPRVAAAAPTCYITSWRAMWDTYGMADAEQNLIPLISRGFGYSDYVMPFAPKPYLVNAGIQDFFSIRGTRETAEEMRRVYSILGQEDRFRLFESDEGHGYTKPRREATYAWFSTHLLGVPAAPHEPDMQPETIRNLWATASGQVSTSYEDAETIGSLNAKLTRSNLYQIDRPASPEAFRNFKKDLLATVSRSIRYRPSNTAVEPQSRGFATPIGGSSSVQRMTFESEPGITIPALLIRSSHPGRDLPLVLYLPHRNKSWDLSGDIETLLTAGYNVISIDVRGKGETERKDVRMGPFYDWFSFDWDVAMMALQLDRPLMTMRTLDIVKSLDFMATLDSGSLASAGIVAVAKGSACIPLLHAALIDERITGIVLEGGLVSWQRMVTDPIHRQQFDNVVPGVLTDYDLPVLTAALAPRPLVLVDLSDPMGHILDSDVVRREYELAFECYRLLEKEDHLMILERPQATPATEVYARALGRDFPSTND